MYFYWSNTENIINKSTTMPSSQSIGRPLGWEIIEWGLGVRFECLVSLSGKILFFLTAYLLIEKRPLGIVSVITCIYFMTREQGNDDIFRMYYTLCPQSDLFELATVMKEQLLGDFSRKISSPITFSIPRNLLTKLLDSEKFLEKSSRFREDDIYKYRVLWLCSSVAYTSSLMTVLHYSVLLEWSLVVNSTRLTFLAIGAFACK